MLDKNIGYQISTFCNMNANNKETDQKDPCFIYSGRNGPRKNRKYQVFWGHFYQIPMIWDGIHLVGLVMEYSSPVWDLSGIGIQDELENVQNRAARLQLWNWEYVWHLKWESLNKRRRDSRLIFLYKGLRGKAILHTDAYIPMVMCCRNHHSLAFRVPISIYKCTPPHTHTRALSPEH